MTTNISADVQRITLNVSCMTQTNDDDDDEDKDILPTTAGSTITTSDGRSGCCWKNILGSVQQQPFFL